MVGQAIDESCSCTLVFIYNSFHIIPYIIFIFYYIFIGGQLLIPISRHFTLDSKVWLSVRHVFKLLIALYLSIERGLKCRWKTFSKVQQEAKLHFIAYNNYPIPSADTWNRTLWIGHCTVHLHSSFAQLIAQFIAQFNYVL